MSAAEIQGPGVPGHPALGIRNALLSVVRLRGGSGPRHGWVETCGCCQSLKEKNVNSVPPRKLQIVKAQFSLSLIGAFWAGRRQVARRTQVRRLRTRPAAGLSAMAASVSFSCQAPKYSAAKGHSFDLLFRACWDLRCGFSIFSASSRPWLDRKLGVLRLLRGWITDVTRTGEERNPLPHSGTET